MKPITITDDTITSSPPPHQALKARRYTSLGRRPRYALTENIRAEGPTYSTRQSLHNCFIGRTPLVRLDKHLCKIVLFLTSSIAFTQAPAPKSGYVPDEGTAIKIAEAVLSPIYGEQTIVRERPFHATLNKGIWYVQGSLPKEMLGGVAMIRIDKRSAAILSYIHGK